jgi:hypothetical protein
MPTHADADLILKLYDLRREPEMRKARKWMLETFWPESVADVSNIVGAFGSQENAWFRQVLGYWEMAASFVLAGVLDGELLLDSSGEMWFICTKFKPILADVRKALHPEFMMKVEKVAEATQRGRERLAYLEKAFAARKERLNTQGAQSQSASS